MLHPLQSIGEGKVYIGPHWSLKQKVCAGDTICAIVSADKSQPEGRLFLTSGQTANLHIGDSALIELDKYPSRKYGYLIGCTKEISFVPNRHCYAVSIQIPYPLITTSGHTVDYEVEQTGIVRFSEKRKIKFLK